MNESAVASDLSKDPFISQLRDTLSTQAGAISSSDSNIEKRIGEAIGGVKTAAEATRKATESSFNREIGYQQEKGASSESTFLESQRGFATNTAAFRSLVDYNQKSIRDLEQRKQELLMQGDATAASTIAGLQLEKLKFENEAAQKTFTNLLSLGTFSIQQKQEERARRSQDFTESQAISNIALKYGITVEPGDTIDSITKKAAPFASAEEKLAMDVQRAQINASNASAAKAFADMAANKPFDAETLALLGDLYNKNPETVKAVVKTTEQLGQIYGAAGVALMKEAKDIIGDNKKNGVSKDESVRDINDNQNLSVTQKAEALSYIEQVYGPDSSQPEAAPANFWKGKAFAEQSLQQFGGALSRFFTP